MGYRSDVKLILTNKGMDMLRSKVPQPTEEEPYWMADPIYEASKICDGKYWLIEWEDIKWYDDWKDYKVPYVVAKLRQELSEINEPYSFMRIGEDYEDNEIDVGYGDYKDPFPYLILKREIDVEY